MTTLARPESILSSPKTQGIACGIGAGALWGLVFLAPELVRGFTPLQLTVGRYLSYGLIAAVLIGPRLRLLLKQIGRREKWQLAWLSLAGNTVYYLLLSAAVQMGGIAMTSLVIGFLPVAVTIIGSRDQGAVPLRRLLPSLLLCAAGATSIGWEAVNGLGSAAATTSLAGLACAVGALASWTTYAISNARCLSRLPHISSQDWNLLTGLMTGAQSIVLLPVALFLGVGDHEWSDWLLFGAVATGLAVLASIVGNALWNRMSRLLPLTLVGQMILFETLFALLYGWAWETRWPTEFEVIALCCVVLSVISCLVAHRASSQAQPAH